MTQFHPQLDQRWRSALDRDAKKRQIRDNNKMAAPLSIETTLKLLPGNELPALGFGVWDSPSHLTTKSCLEALKVGYRHIDTAQVYGNEAEVGEALRQSGLERKDIFVTSKILRPGGDVEAAYKKCLGSIKKIDDDNGYLDLMLIHNATAGSESVKAMWQAMERCHAEGKFKAIGVSNFGIGHIKALKEYAKVWPPAVNQLEVRRTSIHPYEPIHDFC